MGKGGEGTLEVSFVLTPRTAKALQACVCMRVGVRVHVWVGVGACVCVRTHACISVSVNMSGVKLSRFKYTICSRVYSRTSLSA